MINKRAIDPFRPFSTSTGIPFSRKCFWHAGKRAYTHTHTHFKKDLHNTFNTLINNAFFLFLSFIRFHQMPLNISWSKKLFLKLSKLIEWALFRCGGGGGFKEKCGSGISWSLKWKRKRKTHCRTIMDGKYTSCHRYFINKLFGKANFEFCFIGTSGSLSLSFSLFRSVPTVCHTFSVASNLICMWKS